MQLKSVRPLLYWRPLPYNNYLQVHVSDTFGVPRNILVLINEEMIVAVVRAI